MPKPNEMPLRVAVVIPCHNEASTIGKVVSDFSASVPDANIYVFDNESSDGTAEVARCAGATVKHINGRGKGNVARRMFADIEADIYVMVDGDDTYHAASTPLLIEKLLTEQLDMVLGRRIAENSDAFRPGHSFGNRMFNQSLYLLFGYTSHDVLSGFRVFSRRFVKSFPTQSSGFEIEMELTIHALELRMPTGECGTLYRERPSGSMSKLNTYRDGIKILLMMLRLFRMERPFLYFGTIGVLLGSIAIAIAIPLFVTYFETGLVPRLPTAILTTGLILSGALSIFSGLVLENVAHGRRETKMLAYLAIPALDYRKPGK